MSDLCDRSAYVPYSMVAIVGPSRQSLYVTVHILIRFQHRTTCATIR
ncbi:hypothetical protein BIFDEN_00988 [Bifidobacterium dentium ATCC 27678]|nr:hypothetical protein BIFDEN_00988 [Bifidobacterium dentium ATCC 27678]